LARAGLLIASPLALLPPVARRLDLEQPVIPGENGGPREGAADQATADPGGQEPETVMLPDAPPQGGPDNNWSPYGRG
jgi:hypothetical protein